MAKSEGTRKPRQGNVAEVVLLEMPTYSGATAVYVRNKNCTSLTADYDAQVIKVKLAKGGTYIFPFSRCKWFKPDMGTVTQE